MVNSWARTKPGLLVTKFRKIVYLCHVLKWSTTSNYKYITIIYLLNVGRAEAGIEVSI